MVALEVQQGTLDADGSRKRGGGRGGDGRRGGDEADIKSNNPHLTGGEQQGKTGTNVEIESKSLSSARRVSAQSIRLPCFCIIHYIQMTV